MSWYQSGEQQKSLQNSCFHRIPAILIGSTVGSSHETLATANPALTDCLDCNPGSEIWNIQSQEFKSRLCALTSAVLTFIAILYHFHTTWSAWICIEVYCRRSGRVLMCLAYSSVAFTPVGVTILFWFVHRFILATLGVLQGSCAGKYTKLSTHKCPAEVY